MCLPYFFIIIYGNTGELYYVYRILFYITRNLNLLYSHKQFELHKGNFIS